MSLLFHFPSNLALNDLVCKHCHTMSHNAGAEKKKREKRINRIIRARTHAFFLSSLASRQTQIIILSSKYVCNSIRVTHAHLRFLLYLCITFNQIGRSVCACVRVNILTESLVDALGLRPCTYERASERNSSRPMAITRVTFVRGPAARHPRKCSPASSHRRGKGR